MKNTVINEATGILVLLAYWFHLLRNISPAYFLALGFILLLFFFSSLKNRDVLNINPFILVLFGLWSFATITSLIHGLSNGEPGIGLFRFWACIPLAFTAFILAPVSIKNKMQWFVLFYILAAFTFPIQYAIGPIEWFAESSERAGADRFAALTGSLTSYGGSVGVAALATLCFFSGPSSLLLFVFLTMGAILSLQKAAIANILISLILSLWIKGGEKKIIVKTTLLFIFFTLIFIPITIYFDKSDGFAADLFKLGYRALEGVASGNAELSSDVGFSDSIIDRLTALPLAALNYQDLSSLIFGSGVFGGAGALGYTDLPMAHNGIVEIVLIFGIPIGIVVNIFLIYFFFTSLKIHLVKEKESSIEVKFLISTFLLFYVNNIFSGGGFFQPISASVFWLVLFRLRFLNGKHIKKTGNIIN